MATTRSRTGLFLSYRDSTAPRRRRRPVAYSDFADEANDDENEQLIQSSHVAVDVPVLPPRWFRPFR